MIIFQLLPCFLKPVVNCQTYLTWYFLGSVANKKYCLVIKKLRPHQNALYILNQYIRRFNWAIIQPYRMCCLILILMMIIMVKSALHKCSSSLTKNFLTKNKMEQLVYTMCWEEVVWKQDYEEVVPKKG